MLPFGRVSVFPLVTALYLLLDWLNWSMGGKLALLGATALLAVSTWTTRNGCETKVGKSFVLLTGACFFAALGFHAPKGMGGHRHTRGSDARVRGIRHRARSPHRSLAVE